MVSNVGKADKVIRAGIGVVALALAFLVGIGSVGGIVAAAVAVIALITAAVGYCPLYRLFGISSCPTPRR
jgi:hypothetical protein